MTSTLKDNVFQQCLFCMPRCDVFAVCVRSAQDANEPERTYQTLLRFLNIEQPFHLLRNPKLLITITVRHVQTQTTLGKFSLHQKTKIMSCHIYSYRWFAVKANWTKFSLTNHAKTLYMYIRLSIGIRCDPWKQLLRAIWHFTVFIGFSGNVGKFCSLQQIARLRNLSWT